MACFEDGIQRYCFLPEEIKKGEVLATIICTLPTDVTEGITHSVINAMILLLLAFWLTKTCQTVHFGSLSRYK